MPYLPDSPSEDYVNQRIARKIVIGLAVILLFQASWILFDRRAIAAPTPGDQLIDARIISTEGNLTGTTLRNIATASCQVVVFYHSTCPVCDRIAPFWQRTQRVTTNTGNIPVIWVSVSASDTGARAFLSRHELSSNDALGVVSIRELKRLGITAWPRFLLVDSAGHYTAEGPRKPADYKRISGCRLLDSVPQ